MVETWQRESEKINRHKAKQLRRKQLRRRAMIGLSATCAAYIAMLGGWLWHSGLVGQMQQQAASWASNKLQQTGLVLQHITVTGQQALSEQEVLQQANLQRNTPLFALSLAELKAALESHPHIARAKLERRYPDALHIHIAERRPAALWQHAGQTHWIDAQGVLLQTQTQATHERNAGLLVVTGQDAPKHMPALQALIDSQPALAPRIKAAQWVGQRRWNLLLADDVKLLLPQAGAAQALQRLVQLQQEYALLERSVTQIDLRVEDKLFVRYQEQSLQQELPLNAITASL